MYFQHEPRTNETRFPLRNYSLISYFGKMSAAQSIVLHAHEMHEILDDIK